MRLNSLLIFFLNCHVLFSQTDSVAVFSAPVKYAKRSDTTFVNVCRNDTLWLYDWQYDSTKYYRKLGISTTIWGTEPSSDTLIRVGKEEYHPGDFHGWLHDWMREHNACHFNMIYYNTGELHMTFQDYGEGHYGEYREYHKNGQLKCTGSYCPSEIGVRFGEWKWYDEAGKLIVTKNYKGDKYCTGENTRYRRFSFYRRVKDY